MIRLKVLLKNMEIQLINKELIADLREKAQSNERLRMNFDLRTSSEDTSQRMLNVLEPGTKVPIHRHLETDETVICIEGCLDEIFYQELPNMDAGGPTHDGERAIIESNFKEIARIRICPKEGNFGMQVPKGTWHSIEVHEPSTIFEAKDGKYVGK